MASQREIVIISDNKYVCCALCTPFLSVHSWKKKTKLEIKQERQRMDWKESKSRRRRAKWSKKYDFIWFFSLFCETKLITGIVINLFATISLLQHIYDYNETYLDFIIISNTIASKRYVILIFQLFWVSVEKIIFRWKRCATRVHLILQILLFSYASQSNLFSFFGALIFEYFFWTYF